MKNTFKYVIFESIDGIEIPVIFSKLIKHSAMAERVTTDGLDGKVVSAGFIKIDSYLIPDRAFSNTGVSFICFGESESLKMKNRAEDSEIIKQSYSQEVSA